MAQFEVAYKRTKRFEGGYVNDPKDAGGETYNGISRRANPSWGGWKVGDRQKKLAYFPRNLNEEKNKIAEFEKQLYFNSYWVPVRGEHIVNQDVANDMFDTAVNMGVGTSVKLSQRQFHLAESGVMDEQLLFKLNSIR